MALLTIQELEEKYNLTNVQKEQIKKARDNKTIKYDVTMELASKLTGYKNPLMDVDSKVGVVKYNEDEIKKLLEII
ncbi:MAG: hypothetical protein ABIA63_10425 [bacterium]